MCKCGSSDFRAVLSPPDVELICPIRPCSRTAMQGTLGGDSSLCNIRPKSLVSVITQEGLHGRIWQPTQSCSSSLGHREQWLLVLITMGVSSSLAKEKNPGSQDWRSEIICSGICSSYWGLQKSPGDSNECEGSRIKDQGSRLQSYFFRKIQFSSGVSTMLQKAIFYTYQYILDILLSMSRVPRQKRSQISLMLYCWLSIIYRFCGGVQVTGSETFPVQMVTTLEERCCLILSPTIYEILSFLHEILNWGHQGEDLFIMAITSQEICDQKQGQVQV